MKGRCLELISSTYGTGYMNDWSIDLSNQVPEMNFYCNPIGQISREFFLWKWHSSTGCCYVMWLGELATCCCDMSSLLAMYSVGCWPTPVIPRLATFKVKDPEGTANLLEGLPMRRLVGLRRWVAYIWGLALVAITVLPITLWVVPWECTGFLWWTKLCRLFTSLSVSKYKQI